VTRSAARNQQLAQSFFCGSTDERMALEHCKRISNQSNGLGGVCRILCREKIRESLEIR
jgi:hypothetical protein